jgi:inner membrane protein
MDSLTHIVTGAVIGEIYLGRKAGNKAILWGAIAGSLPDIDVLIGKFMSTVDELTFHRGFTHSIVFMLLISPLFGAILSKLYKNSPVNFKNWTFLFLFALISHLLLDLFTNWELQLFWPMDLKVAIQNIFVIDPLFTLPLLVAFIWILFKKQKSIIRKKIALTALIISATYMSLTLVNKVYIKRVFEDALDYQGVPYIRFATKPTTFNNILWVGTAETPMGYTIGYYSHFDEDKSILLHYFEKNHKLIQPFLLHEDVQKILDFTMGYYTVEKEGDTLVINDLRFGQRQGWERGKGNFVFSYYVIPTNGGVRVEPKRNTFEEGKEMLKPLWRRIWGDRSMMKEQEGFEIM